MAGYVDQFNDDKTFYERYNIREDDIPIEEYVRSVPFIDETLDVLMEIYSLSLKREMKTLEVVVSSIIAMRIESMGPEECYKYFRRNENTCPKDVVDKWDEMKGEMDGNGDGTVTLSSCKVHLCTNK